MAKPAKYRQVQCYHCRVQFEISPRAMTVSCPKCHKRVQVQDVIVKSAQGLTKLQTCGRVIIEKKGQVVADLVEAHLGIEVKGVLKARALVGGPVFIANKATWKGDCRAPSLRVEAGAKIMGGRFAIAAGPVGEQLGLEALPGAPPLVEDSSEHDVPEQ